MKILQALFILLLYLPLMLVSQDTYNYPTDIVYHEGKGLYYVANWADGDGFILTVNTSLEITGTLFNDLDFAGGLCLVDDVLYAVDNGDLWGGSLPSYLVGIDINNGTEVLRKEIATGGTYLDLMTADNSGNIYICDSEKHNIYKYNILLQQSETFVEGNSKPLGICYDHLNDRIIFTESKSTTSLLKAISPSGGAITTVYNRAGWIEGLIMADDGSFYLTSWSGNTTAHGDEPVVKVGHGLDWEHTLAEDLNRPFGLCLGHSNKLVVCNWGVHDLYVIDLTLFGTSAHSNNTEKIDLFPNPSNGMLTVMLPQKLKAGGKLTVTDLNGQIVYKKVLTETGMEIKQRLNLVGHPPGLYLLTVQSENSVYREKIVIR